MSQYPHGDPVEEARLLLPWYITGKLSKPEHALVEQMLAQHPALQDEYERELKMVDMIRANTGLLQISAVDTTQYRLDKLMKRISREELAKAAPAAPVGVTPKTRTSRWNIKQFLHDWLPTLPSLTGFTPANTVFASLLVLQVGVLGWLTLSPNPVSNTPYRTVTMAEDQNSATVVKGLVLLVDFNPDSQMRQVRDFLHQWDARILDGPNDLNMFKIEVKGVKPADQQQSDAVLQQMGQDQTVIAFIGREF